MTKTEMEQALDKVHLSLANLRRVSARQEKLIEWLTAKGQDTKQEKKVLIKFIEALQLMIVYREQVLNIVDTHWTSRGHDRN